MPQYTQKPNNFVLCLAAEGECPVRGGCLRSVAYSQLASDGSDAVSVPVVNFHNPGLRTRCAQCEMFVSAAPVRFAKGMVHLFDNVPKGKFRDLCADVQKCFGCRRVYFYCRKGEQLITPKQQAAVAEAFSRHGIAETPCFDDYVEEISWK